MSENSGLAEAVGFHHVELWVPSLDRSRRSWDWLLTQLGWRHYQEWEHGCSWRAGAAYLVIEQSPVISSGIHDRMAPGLNHVALHAPSRSVVDEVNRNATEHGWSILFPERYPYAGGDAHYAGYLVDSDGYEAEIVAPDRSQ